MTDIDVQYYTDQWNDLTAHVQSFKIEDFGIQKLPTATVTLLAKEADVSSFLANPRRRIRIRAKPASTWMNLFYGWVDNPHHKALRGMPTQDMRYISLDAFHEMQSLVRDTITFDYYELQNAIDPLETAQSWTFREVIEDFLLHPDSYVAGWEGDVYSLSAATDTNGIDHIIDASCAFRANSLLDAIRSICDRIGYDGYLWLPSEFTQQIKLSKFDKSPVGTLGAPYISEPMYEGGSGNDVSNIVFLWGGTDKGVPPMDRWTEYGYQKYDPKIWTATRSGAITYITDEDNDPAFEEYNRFNDKCLKINTTGSTSQHLHVYLNLANAEWTTIDCLNRVGLLTFALKFHLDSNPLGQEWYINIFLYDNSGNKILYRVGYDWSGIYTDKIPPPYEKYFQIQVGGEISSDQNLDVWSYEVGTSFDWEHVTQMEIQVSRTHGVATNENWGIYLDGLQFQGGLAIQPFQPYSSLLNPPFIDETSIGLYGVGVYHHQDATIATFEQAQAEGTRLLNNLKTPIPRITLKKILPTTQFRPSNVITVSGVDYRLYGVVYEWKSKIKDVHAEYHLVGKTNPLPPIWTEQNELRFIIK